MTISKFAATLSGVMTAAFVAFAAQAEEVRVYNWSDYIDEEILKDFEKETGIKVVYDVFDSNEILETKLLAGKTGYDIVVPSHAFLSRQIKAGIFQKLDMAQLPNAKNIWKDVADRVARFDPGNEFSVNYMWGSTGLGYVKEKVAERIENPPTNSWSLVFDPKYAKKLQDCGIYWLDAPTEVMPAALAYLGKDGNSRSADDMKEAAALLEKVRPFVRKFHSSEYISALANGEICVAIGWSGDVLQARDRASEAKKGVTVEYSIPKEGTQMWFDQLAIPADAPNPKAAHKFINYLLEAKVIAKATNYVNYANGNLASQEFIDPEVLADTAIYPDAETVKNLFVVDTYAPKLQRVVTRAWTRLKTGQ
ncbi:MAG: polyamine ABC transporter substrate-binding protein [Pseudomonadota bacterium]